MGRLKDQPRKLEHRVEERSWFRPDAIGARPNHTPRRSAPPEDGQQYFLLPLLPLLFLLLFRREPLEDLCFLDGGHGEHLEPLPAP